ncbi:MAG: hypothetical protein M1831_000361 [Alyxoria varia]|nr:MAG: hypothetical protein M1831_000361 [Alyxoria varia]
MRAKRSKQYRKLMQQYDLHFGFREPYQVILDAGVLLDAARFKMSFVHLLSRTLHGEVKPMITQCCMRHLYMTYPKPELVIEHAKQFERRRCNHHHLEKPLSTLECLSSIVDPKGSRTNKHRYVVASQDDDVRSSMRSIPGVPLIYLKRSVMILEPMPTSTEEVAKQIEWSKFESGLKGQGLTDSQLKKLPRNINDELEVTDGNNVPQIHGSSNVEPLEVSEGRPMKKRKQGPSGPNPLAVKKPKASRSGIQGSSQKNAPGDSEQGEGRQKRKRHAKSAARNIV